MRKTPVVWIFFFIMVATGAIYFLINKKQSSTRLDTSAITTTVSEIAGTNHIPTGWREYQNATYHFSLLYPKELSVTEHSEGGGAITVTFQNEQEAKGFQIFIVPYAEPQISESRFKKDVPSGVRTDLVDITIDTATGASFYSTDAMLGETKEIWFVHDGWLYEVTTIKPLDLWLDEIMKTWKFL